MKHTTLATCALLLTAPFLWADRPNIGSVVRHDAAFDKLVARDAKIEVLASGFIWSEGPVWDRKNSRLLWSDVPANTIYQWSEKKEGHSVFMTPSGYTGITPGYPEPGSNGLSFDAQGRLVELERLDRAGARIWSARFRDYRPVSSPESLPGEFAFQVLLDFPRVDGRAKLDFQQVDLVTELPDDLFSLQLHGRGADAPKKAAQ